MVEGFFRVRARVWLLLIVELNHQHENKINYIVVGETVI